MAGDLPPRVLTLVLTIEYNGFRFAGFQRQSATPPRCDGAGGDCDGSDGKVSCGGGAADRCNSRVSSGAGSSAGETGAAGNGSKHKRSAPDVPSQRHPNKRAKNNAAPITVQHQIELALQQWTGLSINTLRVRGAGRTDKGVHASGQVVAFDFPLRLLGSGRNEDADGQADATDKANEVSAGNDGEALSEQCIPLLRGAYETLAAHRQSNNTDTEANNATTRTDQWQIRRAITTRLPPDIAIRSARVWTRSHPFEARQGISRKTYVYRLRFRQLSYLGGDEQTSSSTANQQPSLDDVQSQQMHPICNAGPHLLRRVGDNNDVWLCPWPLDTASLLRRACHAFVGNRDFYNFVHKEERKRADRCSDSEGRPMHEIDLFRFDVDANEVVEEDPTLPPAINATFTLEARGFRRSMVRNLVGFVVDVARGVGSADDIPVLLREEESGGSDGTSDGKALASRVHSAPACGLCLAKVEYEHGCFL
ncbi:hypothetical protein ACHAXT_006175 [Thalassiosira profunda]